MKSDALKSRLGLCIEGARNSMAPMMLSVSWSAARSFEDDSTCDRLPHLTDNAKRHMTEKSGPPIRNTNQELAQLGKL